MSRFKFIAIAGAVLCFFVLTQPANHSEAEDAYFYARMAEQGAPAEIFHAHHLLYLPAMKGLSAVAGMLGVAGRALPLLIGFSMVCGAAAVCLFFMLTARGRSGACFAAALLFSYGFWRYSTTAEIYIPATAFSLAALLCIRRCAKRNGLLWAGAAFAAVALLMHVVTWPLVLVAVPFYLVATRRVPQAVIYLTVVLTVVAVVYTLAVSGPGLTVYSDALAFRDTLTSPRAWIKGAAAWSQNVGSANFLFAIKPVAEKIQAFFPYHMLQEELFMGEAAPGWIRFVAPVSFIAVVLGMMIMVAVVLRNVRDALKRDWQWLSAVLIWFGGVSITALVFEPANPEMWICSLVPFWLLVGGLWSARQSSSAKHWAPAGLAIVLCVHNAVGGIGMVASPYGDYCRQKAGWLIDEAQADDLILTAESHSFVTFLQYHTAAQVVNAKFITPRQWESLQSQSQGRVFVYGDMVGLLPAVRLRAPGSVEQLGVVGQQMRQSLIPVYTNQFGLVYEWGREEPRP